MGGFIAAVVLFTGTVMVNLVASLMPAAALLVALLTYVLQVVVLAVVFVALSGSPLVDDADLAHVARSGRHRRHAGLAGRPGRRLHPSPDPGLRPPRPDPADDQPVHPSKAGVNDEVVHC